MQTQKANDKLGEGISSMSIALKILIQRDFFLSLSKNVLWNVKSENVTNTEFMKIKYHSSWNKPAWKFNLISYWRNTNWSSRKVTSITYHLAILKQKPYTS